MLHNTGIMLIMAELLSHGTILITSLLPTQSRLYADYGRIRTKEANEGEGEADNQGVSPDHSGMSSSIF